jgi:hypothetical protein
MVCFAICADKMHCLGMVLKPKNCKYCIYVKEFTNLAVVPYKVILKTSDYNGIISPCLGREGRGNNIYTPNSRRHQVPLKKLLDV